ncbi:MAG: glycosyltransferase family 9 protein [Thermaurantimonas sp.]
MKVLAIRFSSMGDVALMAAAAKCWLQLQTNAKLIVCSRPHFEPLFSSLERCEFIGADVKKHYKGLVGMKILADHLAREYDFDHVADLHDVIRSRVLCTFLRFKGYTISRINKERSQKRRLTRQNNKVLKPLKHTVQRYLDALPGEVLWADDTLPIYNQPAGKRTGHRRTIGIAPYAKHQTKQWPESKMSELVDRLTNNNIKCLIFGSYDERRHFKSLFYNNSLVDIIPDNTRLEDEIYIIKTLDAFVAMDSFNMHLAALYGVPVVSIWGPTHPYAGFGPLGRSEQRIVQIDLECRPCSIYGNKPCFRGDHACMVGISVERVYKEVMSCLEQ